MSTQGWQRALAFALAMWTLAGPAHAETQVLLVFDEDKDLPGLTVINRHLQEVLRAQAPGPIEFYSESLRLSQFNRPGDQDALLEFFRSNYRGRQLDLIVAVMEPSLDFLLTHAQTLFPGVPIVFCGPDLLDFQANSLPPNVTGVVLKRTFAPTLDVALRLQPDTRSVFVIGGSSRFDQSIQAIARREFEHFDKRLNFTWLNGLAMPQLLTEVSALPSDSIVFYLTLFVDGSGEAFIPHEALSRIAQSANAPVYVAVDQYVGLGAVGGHVYSVADLGQHAGAIGARILRGEAPSSIPVTSVAAYRNLFDWRQLERWGIDEKRLPAASEVDYRPVSLWGLYKWYILVGIAVFLMQSALIVALLVNHTQRRRAEVLRQHSEERRLRAEDEVRSQRDELAHALRVSTLGEMTASFAHELSQPLSAIIMNAESAQQMLAGDARDSVVGDALRDVIADANRATQTVHRLRTLFRRTSSVHMSVEVNSVIRDVLRLLDGELRHRRVQTRFSADAGDVHVLGDVVQLQQVLINILINAAEAIAAGDGQEREIHVQSRRTEAGRLEILIRDTGVGLRESDLDQIFEHFVSSKPEGLGMGLAISRSIVQAHGGRIWAMRNEERGLTMHVDLPIANAGG